jgi:hypothetical protein
MSAIKSRRCIDLILFFHSSFKFKRIDGNRNFLNKIIKKLNTISGFSFVCTAICRVNRINNYIEKTQPIAREEKCATKVGFALLISRWLCLVLLERQAGFRLMPGRMKRCYCRCLGTPQTLEHINLPFSGTRG